MTSRERLLTAFRCEGEPDELPIHIRGVPVWDREWVSRCHPSYWPVIEIVSKHGDYEAGWCPRVNEFLTDSGEFTVTEEAQEEEDWVSTLYTLHTPSGGLTSSYHSSKRGLPGMQTEHYIKQPEDVQKILSIPYLPPQPDCTGFFELDKHIGDRGITIVALDNPLTYIHRLMGSVQLAMWSVQHRDLIMRMLEVFTQRLEDLVRYLLSQGVGPVFGLTGDEYAAPPLHSPLDFGTFCTDFEPQMTRPVTESGGLWHVHCHGPLDSILEDFLTIGANCLHPLEGPPMGDVTLAEGKRRLAGKICIEGNIQIGEVYSAPTEQIVEQTRECLEVGAPGGGYILGITASPHTTILSPQTVKNYLALIETAVKRGR